jgi:hypothetical protein
MKLYLMLGILAILLFGCTQMDPAVGCWYYSVLGMKSTLTISGDGSFRLDNPLVQVAGSWIRIDSKTLEAHYYDTVKKQNVSARVIYDEETKTLYLESAPEIRFTKGECPK